MKFKELVFKEIKRESMLSGKELGSFRYMENPLKGGLMECQLFKSPLIRLENVAKYLGWKFILDPNGIIRKSFSDLKMDLPSNPQSISIKANDIEKEERFLKLWEKFRKMNRAIIEPLGLEFPNFKVEVVGQNEYFRIRIWEDIGGELVLDLHVHQETLAFTTNLYRKH